MNDSKRDELLIRIDERVQSIQKSLDNHLVHHQMLEEKHSLCVFALLASWVKSWRHK